MKKTNETAMLSHGYHASEYQGSMKQPIFQTSTYEFENAQQGRNFFAWATGAEEMPEGEQLGGIYTRLGTPNTQLLEARLAVLDGTEQAVVFGSGMAAITSTLFELCAPGEVLLYTTPVYGGTDMFIHHYLQQYKVNTHLVLRGQTADEVMAEVGAKYPGAKVCAMYTETPSNPTMDLFSIKEARSIADAFSTVEFSVPLIVDNTYMGPLFCKAHELGADIVVYSATKYLAGHSDVIAGAATGSAEWMGRVRMARTFMGGILGPMDSWLILRSLETLHLRLRAQAENAGKVATSLRSHPAVSSVRYLGNIEEWAPEQAAIFKQEYSSNGSMIALYIKGGQEESFKVLDHLQVIKLGVSLGSTESLAEHPATMTHSKVAEEHKEALGITPSLIRLSIGVESAEDLITDLSQALDLILP
ncbi:MAG: aminotransferase class I/II-fold pyridoxal phosphate-dependent enzyme [Schleiferiaceae bacterium]|jgi:methionine-gamma-lyase|tara:strand:+ start:6340 stop:7590 length:1251 start_codon:yes stop_codon:yes gene_type:complete